MAGWQQILFQMTNNVEHLFDTLKERLSKRLGLGDPLKIVPYLGYGTAQKLYLKGRVLEDEGITPAGENDSLWDNLLNTYRRFESDEIVGARVLARFGSAEQEVVTDNEGYFELWIEPREPLPQDRTWHEVELELLEPLHPDQSTVRATGKVLVPPSGAEFGIISDIDDTVVRSHATDLLRMARTVFLNNARTRLPFEGVAAFYRALHLGPDRKGYNPLFYVSSSPWNLYDLLIEFLELENIPVSAIFLRDWGISQKQVLPTRHRSHKLEAITKIMSEYEDLQFILIGDSGQHDPEIYEEVVRLYPERVLAVYIRNVNPEPERAEAIRKLAEKVVEAGSTLMLVDDTYTAAEHAVAQGWMAPELLDEVRAEKELDSAPPSAVEKLLGEEEQREGPTVVIEGRDAEETAEAVESGAVEAALQSGDPKHEKPPTVIVEGQRQRIQRDQQTDE